MNEQQVFETGSAKDKLKHIQDFSDRPFDDRVLTLSSLLSDRMNEVIIPKGFIIASGFAIYDLQSGVNGFTGEPIETPLKGANKFTSDLLYANIPELAEVAFSKQFADDVNKDLKEIIGSADLLVKRPLTNIDQAQIEIIDSAVQTVLGFDWESLLPGVEVDKALENCSSFARIILRNSGMNFPLTVLLASDSFNEALLLKVISDDHKVSEVNQYWLAMLKKTIGVDEANLMKLWLIAKLPEVVSGISGFDSDEATLKLLELNKDYSYTIETLSELLQIS